MATTSFAWADPKYKLGTAKGNGTLKVGSQEFKVTSVVIKLLENSKVEINLISEIGQIFVSGTWSRSTNENEINIQITSGATSSFEGSGKLMVRDRKTIDRLNLQGTSRATKLAVEVNFVAETS